MKTGNIDDLLALTRGRSTAYESIHVINLSGNTLAVSKENNEENASQDFADDLKNLKSAGRPGYESFGKADGPRMVYPSHGARLF